MNEVGKMLAKFALSKTKTTSHSFCVQMDCKTLQYFKLHRLQNLLGVYSPSLSLVTAFARIVASDSCIGERKAFWLSLFFSQCFRLGPVRTAVGKTGSNRAFGTWQTANLSWHLARRFLCARWLTFTGENCVHPLTLRNSASRNLPALMLSSVPFSAATIGVLTSACFFQSIYAIFSPLRERKLTC